MAKIIFILQRKSGTTREECLDYWAGERHTSIVRGLPGLTRWVQNHVVSAPAEPAACDGVGELSFASDEVMQAALNSPEMAAAVEDAQNFLDKGLVFAKADVAAQDLAHEAGRDRGSVVECGARVPATGRWPSGSRLAGRVLCRASARIRARSLLGFDESDDVRWKPCSW